LAQWQLCLAQDLVRDHSLLWQPARRELVSERTLTTLNAPKVFGLARSGNPVQLALFFDEVEGLADCSFSDEFLMVLRELHNCRDDYPGDLVVAFAGAIDTNALVKDSAISPFNVAEEIALDDFTSEQACQLSCHLAELGVPVDDDIHSHIYSWTSGQPHLTQRICEILESKVRSSQIAAITPAEVDQVVQERILSPRRRDTNVRHVLCKVKNLRA